MLQVNKLALATLATLVIGSSPAHTLEVTCKYTDKTVIRTVGTIENIRNFRKESTHYAEEKRICAVKFDAKIGKNWVETDGFYVFGPEMSENNACNEAIKKGKVKVLNEFAAQDINSIQKEICSENITTADAVVEERVIKEVVYVDKVTGLSLIHI